MDRRRQLAERAPMAAKLAVPLIFLALLGSVACQGGGYAPSASPPAGPPSLSPSSPNLVAYPPGPSSIPQTTYPPSPSPQSSSPPATDPQPSPSPVAYPPSQGLSSTPPPVYPPSLSPSSPSAPSTSPSPSLNPAPPNYPPPTPSVVSPSPSPSSSISSPPTYPPNPTPSPTSPPSPSPPISPPTQSPPSLISSPPTSPPSPSPASSTSSPPSSPPTPSPPSSISSPPTSPPNATPPAYPPPAPSPPTYPPSPGPSPAPSVPYVGYYEYSCPNAEGIVREAVRNAVAMDPGTGAGLIRLFFHDCFVQGCDASVLLNTTGSSDPTERASPPNLSLRGFEVIDAAKAALEAACPGVVSCADVVAFAGRDATYFLSGNSAVDFAMPAGRYDGRVSLSSEAAANLPPPFAGLDTLKGMFAAKGLDTDDMVTLSGAHTVGRAHCSSFKDRLPPNNAGSDMNGTIAGPLAARCNGSDNPTAPQDSATPDGLDSQYYRNVLNHEVLFASDAALLASNQTADLVSDYAFTPGRWENKFKAAMVKMGGVGVKTSANGEIRKQCWMVN